VPALIDAELETLGSDYQANGYTTIGQAQELGRRLGLAAGDTLLDVGSGCGFPGLYLAAEHGCRLITADPVSEGAAVAITRAERDDMATRHAAIVASGTDLPFLSGSVDGVVHTDVLC
jgi:sarcosine/dimethylglycine N-methyltransferase